MTVERRTFHSRNLERVASLEDIPGTTERLHIGDWVKLNSGGPVMLVVDMDGGNITVSWEDAGNPIEDSFSRPCLSLIPLGAVGLSSA